MAKSKKPTSGPQTSKRPEFQASRPAPHNALHEPPAGGEHPPANPERPNLTLLIISIALLGLWMGFLVFLALVG